MLRWFRIGRLLLYAGLVVAGLLPAFAVSAQERPPEAYVIRIDHGIDPNYAKYLERGLDRAQDQGAEFVIVIIDTPGGMLSSMRAMVEDILASSVPVITFVAPSGARAGSAGTFITAAGHLAVMAPGTNIGAASPVAGSGEELPETLASKVTNDAAALMRSIAEERGKNSDALERTVREAAAFTANEAFENNIIDFLADDLDHLVEQLNGVQIGFAGKQVTLDSTGVSCAEPRSGCTEVRLSFVERFLAVISNPNVAGMLLTLGGLGLFLEFLSPGVLLPGVLGAIMLALAFVAAGNLPLNWAGAGLLLFAFVLIYFELQVTGFGILGLGALVSFVLGVLFLFAPWAADPPSISGPRIQISPWLVSALICGFGLAVAVVVYLMWRGKGSVPVAFRRNLVGMVGRVTMALDPVGTVYVGNEPWTAESVDGLVIEVKEKVEVVEFEGLRLKVRKVPKLLSGGGSLAKRRDEP